MFELIVISLGHGSFMFIFITTIKHDGRCLNTCECLSAPSVKFRWKASCTFEQGSKDGMKMYEGTLVILDVNCQEFAFSCGKQ